MVPRKYRFVSNRILRNKSDEEKGKVRVLVKTDSDVAETDYLCPECGKSEHLDLEWVRPFKFRCSECGFLIRLSKLKDEIKREKRKNR